ncbi:SLBB domain-containing protein [Pseudoalteromonas gelatinilytica]
MAIFLLNSFLYSAAHAQSVSPTKQQIEQFKKLPKAQQQALAKKYGLNMSLLNNSNDSSTEEVSDEPTVLSRDPFASEQEQMTSDEIRFKPKEESIKPFGYELFSGQPTSFAPTENALVPDTYLVGAGDTISVNLFGKESLSEEVTIDREGRLSISNLKPVTVAGMEYRDVVNLIKAKVKNEMIGTDVFVSMGKTRSIRIMVLGEAYKPGAYTIPSLSSITHALFISGGISEIGSLRNIHLKRAGKTIQTLDLYDLLIQGDSTDDVMLKPGDVVFIPAVGEQVTIKGDVRRPAIYELKGGESNKDLMKMAGGLNASAYPQNTIIERYTGNSDKTVLQINLTNSNQYKPQNGDVINVPSSSEQLDKVVTLIGAVTYPGNFAWKEGQRVSDLFRSIKTDVLPIADFDYSLLAREINAKGDIELHQFSLLKAINGNELHNLTLQSNDKIFVFSRFQSIKDEQLALNNVALTKEQIERKEQLKLWDEYQQRQFYDFIGLESLAAQNVDESLKEQSKVTSNFNLLNIDEEEELADSELAIFSRTKMLKPILAKLKEQSLLGEDVDTFTVEGAVSFAGVYPLAKNTTVKNAIIAAGGLKESAFLGETEITRLVFSDTYEVEHIQVNLESELNKESGFQLKSKDSINVFPKPNWQEDIKVKLYGEVRFPGTYTIKKGESLTEVLNRAGGLTEFSSPEAAVFTRKTIQNKQQQELLKLSQELRRNIAAKSFNTSITEASLSYQDMNNLIDDLSKVQAVGRLVIDLPGVLDGRKDIALENGDALYVPSESVSVNVVGEVNFSSSHLYEGDLTLSDYINRSGGLKQRADEERVYIIKASGLVVIPDNSSWFAVNDKVQLSPGDTIVVPLDTDYIDNLTLWSSATQILYQMGVAVAAIGSL